MVTSIDITYFGFLKPSLVGTQMTFKFGDEILPRAYGFPMKIRVPTKLGFKNPKYVMSMEVTNDYKGGFWEDQGYNSFSGS